MRLGIVSDAHCNAAALCTAVELLRPRVDGMLFAGDAVLQYRFSNEVLELIQAEGMGYVQGNHEMTLLQHGKAATSRPDVRRRNLEFMAAAPRQLEMNVGGGKKLLMVHACPFPPHDQYLYPAHPLLGRCADTEADFVVLGHTHIAMKERVGSTLVVNPGALGERSDPDHPGMVSCAVLDTDTDEFEVHRFADPARRATA